MLTRVTQTAVFSVRGQLRLGRRIQILKASTDGELGGGVRDASQQRADALLVSADHIFRLPDAIGS
jgi:hypothetical protein